jgi:hypothetical protein
MYSWLGVWGLIPDRRCACQSRSAGVCLSTSPPRDGRRDRCVAMSFAPTTVLWWRIFESVPSAPHASSHASASRALRRSTLDRNYLCSRDQFVTEYLVFALAAAGRSHVTS